MAKDGDLGWRLRAGWGLGSLGAATLLNGVTFLALFYFTRVLGLDPALAGALLFAAKLYGIAADPLVGLASDAVRRPAGRRRPFLLAGAATCTVAFAALFNAPPWTGAWLAAWCTAALALCATGYTLFIVPYLAMPAEMTASYHERSRLMSLRVVFAALGILAGGALAPLLVSALGGGRRGYALMSLVLAALVGATMAGTFLATAHARFTVAAAAPRAGVAQLRDVLGHEPFAWLIGSKLAHLFGVAVSNSLLLFVITGVFGRGEAAAGLFGLAAAAGTLGSMPGWLAACRRFGKRATYLAGVALYLPVALSWLLADAAEPAAGLLARGLGVGVATGGLTLTAQAMLPDAIADDARRTGLRREGSFAAVYSAVEKGAAALGPLAAGLLLAGADGGPGAAARIRLAAALVPAAASLLSALVLLGYRLDRSLHRNGKRDFP